MSEITTDFIKATKKLYEKVATILTHLQIIEGYVKSISEKPVHYASATEANSNGKEPSADPKKPSETSVGHIETGESKRNTNNRNDEEEKSRKDFKKRWKKSLIKPIIQIQIAALIVLAFYTCETRRTNNLTEESVRFQAELALAQQRSYVWLALDDMSYKLPKLDDMTTLVFPLPIKNTGRAIAKKINYVFMMEFPERNRSPSFNLNQVGTSIGTIGPLYPASVPLPIDIVAWDVHSNYQFMTHDLREDLRTGKRYMVRYGKITYEDTFGSWWTQVCVYDILAELPVGQTRAYNANDCVLYNTEGGTPKKPTD